MPLASNMFYTLFYIYIFYFYSIFNLFPATIAHNSPSKKGQPDLKPKERALLASKRLIYSAVWLV